MPIARGLIAFRDQRREAKQRATTALQLADGRLVEARMRLSDLDCYVKDYRSGFSRYLSRGCVGSLIADYTAFVARMDDAIAMQRARVMRLAEEREATFKSWQQAARDVAVTERLVSRQNARDRARIERRERIELDERIMHGASIRDV